MKKLAILSVSAILFIGLAAFQQPKPKKPTKAGAKKEVKAAKVTLSDKAYDVKFDKTFHDFGKAAEGEQVETIFVITNVGKEPVLIKSHEVQCGCTTPSYSMEPIMPGKSTNIKVGFNTNGKMGMNDKTVKITTNGGVHELKFKCEVTPKAAVDPIEPGNPVKIKTN
jgi:hypothetical protein